MHTFNKIKILNTKNNINSNSNSINHGMANANDSTHNLTNNNNKDTETIAQQQIATGNTANKLVRQSNTQASLSSLRSGSANLNRQTHHPASKTNFFNTSVSRSSTCSFNPINKQPSKQQETLATTATINSNLNKQNSTNVDPYYLSDTAENNCLLSNSAQTIIMGKNTPPNPNSATLQSFSANLIQQSNQNKSNSSIFAHLNRTLSNIKNKNTNTNKSSNPAKIVPNTNNSNLAANSTHLSLPRHTSCMLKSNSEPTFRPLVDEEEEEEVSSPKTSINSQQFNPTIKEDLILNNDASKNNSKKSKPRLLRTISIDSNSGSTNAGLNTSTKTNNTAEITNSSTNNNQKISSTIGEMYQINTNKYSLNSPIPNHYHQTQLVQQYNSKNNNNKNEPPQIVETLNETNLNDLLNPHLIPRLVRKSLIDLHKKSVWNLSHNPNNKNQSTSSSNNPTTSPNAKTGVNLFSSKKTLASSGNSNPTIVNYSTGNTNIQSNVASGITPPPPPLPPPPNEEIKMKFMKNYSTTNYHT
jgi:hypothetical protein